MPVESFRADLLSRKAQVEEEKRKEREQKIQNAVKNLSQEQEFDPFNTDTKRSLASSILSEPSSDPAPFYPEPSVALYTSFQSKKTPVEVQTRVEQALADLSSCVVNKKEHFKTKVELKSEGVSFAARIYALANVSIP